MRTRWLPEQVIQHYIIKPQEKPETISGRNFDAQMDKPLNVEIGSGNGHFLVNLAKEKPNELFLGVELKFDRICKTVSKLEKRGIENVRLFFGDAFLLFKDYLAPESVSSVYYNFPDPWPKRRHHKKRLIQPDFLRFLYNALAGHGVFTCATDHKEYLKWMLRYIELDTRFGFVFKDKVVSELNGYHSSLFEEIWRDMGKDIYYYRIMKK